LGSIFERDDLVCDMVVNSRGERFVDEAAGLPRSPLPSSGDGFSAAGPGRLADHGNKVLHFLHGEYRVHRY
jgi:hypothetical protein